MSLVVVQETERFLFKPYTSAKAVYHAVVFLNQIVLTKRRGEGRSDPSMSSDLLPCKADCEAGMKHLCILAMPVYKLQTPQGG